MSIYYALLPPMWRTLKLESHISLELIRYACPILSFVKQHKYLKLLGQVFSYLCKLVTYIFFFLFLQVICIRNCVGFAYFSFPAKSDLWDPFSYLRVLVRLHRIFQFFSLILGNSFFPSYQMSKPMTICSVVYHD